MVMSSALPWPSSLLCPVSRMVQSFQQELILIDDFSPFVHYTHCMEAIARGMTGTRRSLTGADRFRVTHGSAIVLTQALDAAKAIFDDRSLAVAPSVGIWSAHRPDRKRRA